MQGILCVEASLVKLTELFVCGDDADKEPCGNTENGRGGTAAIVPDVPVQREKTKVWNRRKRQGGQRKMRLLECCLKYFFYFTNLIMTAYSFECKGLRK